MPPYSSALATAAATESRSGARCPTKMLPVSNSRSAISIGGRRPAACVSRAPEQSAAPAAAAASNCSHDAPRRAGWGSGMTNRANSRKFLLKKIAPEFEMQTRGSTAGFGIGEREEELRRRNEDVDRRRAEAMRLASDVVRHQEVRRG